MSVRPAPKRQRRVGGNLEQDVAEEEDAGGGAVCGGAQAQVGVHRQGCDRDVGPINEVDHIQHEQQGQQPARGLAQGIVRGLAAIVATCGSFRGPVEQLHHEMTPTRSL